MGLYFNFNRFKYVFVTLIFDYSHPSGNNDPVRNYKPIENHKINFIHINNNGLSTDLSPNKQTTQFWEHVLREGNNQFGQC